MHVLKLFNSQHYALAQGKSIMGRTKKATKTASFRIDCSLLDALMDDSNRKQISLNTLVNQILREYIEWYANAPKVGYLIVRKSLISAMLEKFNEDQIRQLAKLTSKQSREINLLFTSEYNIESALKVIEYKLRMSGYVYRKDVHNDQYVYTIEHGMGPKWSLYLAELFAAEFQEVNRKAEFEKLDNLLAFKVHV
jgi:hypothetical protein